MPTGSLKEKEKIILVLASSSPQRLRLLSQIGIYPDKVDPADLNEKILLKEKPKDYAYRMSLEKARIVFKRNPYSYILSGDTIVSVGRRILGKPKDRNEAFTFLKLLNGRRHKVISAVTLVSPIAKEISKTVISQVKFSYLSDYQLKEYIERGEWKGKAGGYAIQGFASSFIPWINGSYSGVVGFPLNEVKNILFGAGWKSKKNENN